MLRIDFTNRKRPDDGELLRTLSVKVSVREVSLVEEFPLEVLYCSRSLHEDFPLKIPKIETKTTRGPTVGRLAAV